jgi:hypothetical protein
MEILSNFRDCLVNGNPGKTIFGGRLGIYIAIFRLRAGRRGGGGEW